jgi:hypothetical protein
MNYKVLQKNVNCKIIHFLLICVNSFSWIYQSLQDVQDLPETARSIRVYQGPLMLRAETHTHTASLWLRVMTETHTGISLWLRVRAKTLVDPADPSRKQWIVWKNSNNNWNANIDWNTYENYIQNFSWCLCGFWIIL